MHRPGRPAFNVELPDLPPRSLSESPAYQDGQSDSEPFLLTNAVARQWRWQLSVAVVTLLETKSCKEVTASGNSNWRQPEERDYNDFHDFFVENKGM